MDLSRRGFFRVVGVTSVLTLLPRGMVMAGPFVKEDFSRLIPVDKKLDRSWVPAPLAGSDRGNLRPEFCLTTARGTCPGLF